ncbi:MAG: AAA family ATPase [Synergistaceae bacterium]|nr:AAA family ATPase [Synergistaceae bacterium]
MIERLVIENIGGIKSAELSFTAGLNVITGESGAGKSSVVRSLELLTGSRGGVKFIRAGETRGNVEAVFTDTVIMREILSTGRSRVKIDGQVSGLSECVEKVNSLVRIQSQFAQMELLEPERQLAMIDSCLPLKVRTELFESFREIFDKARASASELRAIKKRRSEIEKKYANAREIFDLVKIAKPEPGLEMRLENELSDITHRIATRERARESLNLLTGGLSANGLIGNTESCFESLYEFMNEEDADEVRLSIETLYGAVKNLSGNFGDEADDLTFREETETRLGALRKLKRLCNIPDEKELLTYCDEIYVNLEWLEKSYKELEELSSRSLDEKKRANALAMEIRRARHEAGEILSERVNSVLSELAMSGITFKINFSGLQKLSRDGADEIEFILTDGSRSGAVGKIASGGELSRLLLALQLSLPDEWLPPTIIFDEVEAGLGGKAAVLSGLQLKKLSRKCQVILVTHEASIAALGDSHILIQRMNGESAMKSITGEERVMEIARMLSGSPDMSEAQEHARILLNSPNV